MHECGTQRLEFRNVHAVQSFELKSSASRSGSERLTIGPIIFSNLNRQHERSLRKDSMSIDSILTRSNHLPCILGFNVADAIQGVHGRLAEESQTCRSRLLPARIA